MRRWSYPIMLAAVAVAVAACSSGQPIPANITINNPGTDQAGITVSGTGEVTGTPDTITVALGVSVLADTVADASAQAAEKANALIDALASNGVDRDDITTTDYSIYPEYDWRDETENLIGYRVSNTVRVKIRDVTDAGDVLDAAVSAAGDDVRVHELYFSLEDNKALVEAARQAAWEDALAKATQLADLAGRNLGPATAITEAVSQPPVPIPFEQMFDEPAEDAALTPIEPGTSTVMISLDVHFDFQG